MPLSPTQIPCAVAASTLGGVRQAQALPPLATHLSPEPLADERSRTKLPDQRARRHARDGAEVGNQMCLVVVAGRGGDGGPALVSIFPCGAEGAMEACELCESLRAQP